MVLLPDIANFAVAKFGHLRFGQQCNIAVTKPNGAGRGAIQARDEIQKGTLPRSAFTNDSQLLSLVYSQNPTR